MNSSLTKQRKDVLENAALHAFGGSISKLVNGIRIIRDGNQIAAVYWADNNKENDIEIAVCESRLTDEYKLSIVHRWLDHQRAAFPAECNVHKHGSEWPIFGFAFDNALTFLGRCRELRRGFLSKELLASLNASTASMSPELVKAEATKIALSSLLPQTRQDVIDLVSRAGVNVSDWYTKKDGSPALAPRSNPNYCYNWAFGGGLQPTVICLWHSDLAVNNDNEIVYEGSMREHASRLSAIAESSGEDSDVRSRARSQAERARQLDILLVEAWSSERPIRVIVVEGQRRADEALGKESSVVKKRKLDAASWYLHHYDDESGQFLLVRGVENAANIAPTFVDQYTHLPATKQETTGFEFIRKRAVRDSALLRAQGICELCGVQGFATSSGNIFLETHHVIPLSEGGADADYNVVALCPNDHREAHYGANAQVIRKTLQQRLAGFFGSPRNNS